MILSGHRIREELNRNIVIDPFSEANLNPNSYNLSLHNELMTYEEVLLDMRKANRVRRLPIPPEGLVLRPNQLYLGRTAERTETHNLVPMIEGRSSKRCWRTREGPHSAERGPRNYRRARYGPSPQGSCGAQGAQRGSGRRHACVTRAAGC